MAIPQFLGHHFLDGAPIEFHAELLAELKHQEVGKCPQGALEPHELGVQDSALPIFPIEMIPLSKQLKLFVDRLELLNACLFLAMRPQQEKGFVVDGTVENKAGENFFLGYVFSVIVNFCDFFIFFWFKIFFFKVLFPKDRGDLVDLIDNQDCLDALLAEERANLLDIGNELAMLFICRLLLFLCIVGIQECLALLLEYLD